MRRSKRFKTIVDLAQVAEKDAARRLSQSTNVLQEYERKLDHLKKCREEYQLQFKTGVSGTFSGAQLRSYSQFMQKMDEAIAQLETQQVSKQKENEAIKTYWQETYNKHRVLGEIADKYTKTEEKAMIQKEQREVDDRSQRQRITFD